MLSFELTGKNALVQFLISGYRTSFSSPAGFSPACRHRSLQWLNFSYTSGSQAQTFTPPAFADVNNNYGNHPIKRKLFLP